MNLKKQFVRFALVGATATLATYSTLVFLVESFQVDAVLASVAGYLVGMAVNYGLNYQFTFQSSQKHQTTIPKFLIVMTVGLGLNSGIMYSEINWLGIHYIVAQLVATAVVLVWSFTANRLWTFIE